ncbi:MAG: hypothetical protein Q9174_001852 [Haloplaca sp. 1 TL-2023]
MDAPSFNFKWHGYRYKKINHIPAAKPLAVKTQLVNHIPAAEPVALKTQLADICIPGAEFHFQAKDSRNCHLAVAIRMSSEKHDQERKAAEVSADQVVVDGSVGSDTESSKALTSDAANKDPSEQPHHAHQVVIDDSVGSVTESSKTLTSDAANKDPSAQPHHAHQVVIDDSVGSNTESSKALTSDTVIKDPSEQPHHARSNSVKKPSNFKAVSVTKNFLAKAGTTTAPAVKGPGDGGLADMRRDADTSATPANNILSAPRPRLVAKPASGHQATASKSSASAFKNGGGSGPDPLQVWNRNRAVPPTARKEFTDEELKQRYGISLATRLEADGDGKEAKWADLEDDEDDWAPETIEWNDGTKITLTDSNATAALAEEQAVQAHKEKQEAEAKAKAAQAKPATTVGPNATVLKLGQAGQPKGGLVLKSPMEKPTLVAKPTAPAPVKSPWASIPTIDKVPPVPINPPAQATQQRPQQAEIQRSDLVSPPISAAVEIAADSFTRNRRDSPNAPPGQLFNSQSGQYEPVVTGRRGSVRKEQNFRPPSVLQRPSPSDPRKPAEPSAAFQSNRTGTPQEVGVWTRSGSSTVAGDGGHPGRKISMNQGADMPRMSHDMLQQGRDSQPLQSPALSSHQPTGDLDLAVTSPQQQKAVLVAAPGAPPKQDGKDAENTMAQQKEMQKKLMLEKRDLAIKRRAEQEAKEEAAKRERIRIKMETLGLEPLSKNPTSVPALSGPQTEGQKPVDHDKSEVKDSKSTVRDDKTSPLTVSAMVQAPGITQSPPKPPVPDIAGKPTQYGMMKVHGPPMVNGVTGHDMAAEPKKSRDPAQHFEASSRDHTTPESTAQPPSQVPMVNGDVAVKLPETQPARAPDQRGLQARSSRQQPWLGRTNEVDALKGWSGSSMTTHSTAGGNLWGPPSNHKALGNGTFDQNVQRPQSRQSPYPEHAKMPAPQPIGPPKSMQRSRQSPEAARAPETTSIPLAEDSQTVPAFPSTGSSIKPPMSASSTQTRVPHDQTAKVIPQAHTGMPDLATDFSQFLAKRNERTTVEAWGNFHITAARDAEERKRQKEERDAAQVAEEARTGIRPVLNLAPMRETWRQVSDQDGHRETINVSKRQSHERTVPQPPANSELKLPPLVSEPVIMPPSHSGRNSRFFPVNGPGLQGLNPRAVSLPIGFYRQASPPPPDTVSHPAYAGEGRPLVNLPNSKPRPTVRLPPSTATPNASPVLAAVTAVPLRAISQPLVNNPSWQDRFNGLLGVAKKASPEKKFAQVVDFSASTKIPLDVPVEVQSASVSLPPAAEDASLAKEAGKVTSKAVEDEEELFEDRGFGSVPQVSLPSKAPDGVGFVTATKPKRQTRTLKPVEAESRRTFEADARDSQVGDGLLIHIGFPGMERKSTSTSRGKGHVATQSNTLQSNQRQQRHTSNNQKNGRGYPKAREQSGHFNSNKHSHGGPQRNASYASAGTNLQGNRDTNRRDVIRQYGWDKQSMHHKPGGVMMLFYSVAQASED